MGAGRVIASEFRAKGAAPQLGARRPGESGPFGPYGTGDQDDGEAERDVSLAQARAAPASGPLADASR
jgi:hypothetical protein